MAIFTSLSDDGLDRAHGLASVHGSAARDVLPDVPAGRLRGAPWDIREGIGEPHALAGDATDLLVPIIFILWQATADTSSVTTPYTVGVHTSGRNGGDMRVDVSSEGMQYTPGPIDDCAADPRARPGHLGADRLRAGQRRHGPRQPADGQRLQVPVLRDLRGRAWSERSPGCCGRGRRRPRPGLAADRRRRAHLRRRARTDRAGGRRAAVRRRRPWRSRARHRPQHRSLPADAGSR